MRSHIRTLLKRIKIAFEPTGYWMANIIFYLIPRVNPKKLDINNLGVNFIGYSKGELGLGQAMRSMVFATREALIPVVVRQFNVRITSKQSNNELNAYVSSRCKYPVNIICVNPDMLYRLPYWIGYSEWTKTYNVGYWFWELENFPDAWKYATHMVDEIWVATEFIAEAMRKSGKRVVKIPFPLEFEMPPEYMNKKYFRLTPNEFTFIFSFDFNSVPERKNPQATIRAFKLAFPVGDNSARLILKTMNGGCYSKFRENLEALIDKDPRIEIRDEYLTQEEMRGLIRSCDCYISLHRAEGLGLGLAEAMSIGKPAIATGYSGNVDFMNDDNSIMVPFRLVKIPKGTYPNSFGEQWADPDIDFAATAMKEMSVNKELQAVLGERAQSYMRKMHSYAATASFLNTKITSLYSN